MPRNKTSLLIDFGASRVKSGIVQDGNLLSISLQETLGSVQFGAKIPSSFFRGTLEKHFATASSKFNVEQIFVCSEMHGFCLENPNTGERTEYFSWRYSQKDDKKIIEGLNDHDFSRISGVMPRPGLPIVNLIGSCHSYLDDGYSSVLFLPHLLCDSFDGLSLRAHPTMAQASGLYDLNQTKISLLNPRFDIPMWDDQSDFPKIGCFIFGSRAVPIIGGYGDLQCSINAPQFSKNKWFINLGTGSQTGILTADNIDGFEKRVFFENQILQCKTHLPAGRALQQFAQLLTQIRQESNTDFFWKKLQSIEIMSDHDHLPVFDLALFPEARGYKNGGSIINIRESSFDLDTFLQGLVKSLARSFADEINSVQSIPASEIFLFGKMVSKIPLFAKLLEELTGLNVAIVNPDHEASLLGLFYLSKKHSA